MTDKDRTTRSIGRPAKFEWTIFELEMKWRFQNFELGYCTNINWYEKVGRVCFDRDEVLNI
jgi:hypothetical protein